MRKTNKSNSIQRLTKNVFSNTNLLYFLFLGAVVLTIFEINIYRKTLIHWAIPTFAWLLIGLLLTPFSRDFLKKNIATNNIFLQIVFNVGTWGGILIYGFMASNYYFTDNNSESITTNIVDTGHLAKGRDGCGNPYCNVLIYGKVKQLIFPCDFDIENYDEIILTLSKGLWGFDIIKDKKPINNKRNAL